MRIGINPWPTWEFFYLAQEKGLYRELGVDVRIVEFSSLGDAKRAFERGQVDAFLGTLVEVASTKADGGREPSIAFVTDYSNGADQIIAHASIDGTRQLLGKRVAAEVGSLNVFLLARALDECGASLDEVRMVDLDPLSMLAAFERGDVDAIVAYPPVSVAAAKVPGAHTIYTSARIPGEIVDLLAVDSRWIEERPDDVLAVCRGYAHAVELYRREPQSCIDIMARRDGLTPAEFEAALRDGIRMVEADEQRAYLETDGRLTRAYAYAVAVLERTGQLRATSAAPRIAHSLAARFDAAP